ncbi:hypothetical protein GCM10010252_22990 [Streptomyces aureoverticillatus]|nr:hypothetical protein GCM10010252_22990 [Streptomyces aureoverticillatus]
MGELRREQLQLGRDQLRQQYVLRWRFFLWRRLVLRRGWRRRGWLRRRRRQLTRGSWSTGRSVRRESTPGGRFVVGVVSGFDAEGGAEGLYKGLLKGDRGDIGLLATVPGRFRIV